MMDSIRMVPGLSVFLPAHNEAGNIERVVNGFRRELPSIADSYEIIIVNDGSSDGTGEIADGLSVSIPEVRVVHHVVNQGYGAAVISGIRAATQPYVLLCDGDGQFDPVDVRLLVAQIHYHDVVVGRRRQRADHFMRRLNGRSWTLLMRILFRIRISDIDCGFKLLRRDFLDGMELHAGGAMVTTELMARLASQGARICEVDVKHLPRLSGEQSGNSAKVILRAFRELFLLYNDLRRTTGVKAASASHRSPRHQTDLARAMLPKADRKKTNH
jgi:glycosyltransferase involved in cell wall biosynthesis